jgi:hypothetical protein
MPAATFCAVYNRTTAAAASKTYDDSAHQRSTEWGVTRLRAVLCGRVYIYESRLHISLWMLYGKKMSFPLGVDAHACRRFLQ